MPDHKRASPLTVLIVLSTYKHRISSPTDIELITCNACAWSAKPSLTGKTLPSRATRLEEACLHGEDP